ncbi:Arginine metabolism regulation protein II [Spathaspora sp. JA1]|nr:Arginine metabolism regulation protein II [Spathaspora sp. JA1]
METLEIKSSPVEEVNGKEQKSSEKTNNITKGFKSKRSKTFTGFYMDASAPHDQLWLSNELRDDALLTAAALDTQFLDFMNAENNIVQSNNQRSNFNPPYNFNNPNDLLNLVFHKNQNISTISPHSPHSQTHTSNSHMSMSKLLNDTSSSSTMIDPTNQHLYYSNYNDYYYNNPYSTNETLQIHLHASPKVNIHDDAEATDLVDGEHTHGTHMPTSIMKIVENPLKLGIDLSLPSTSSTSPQVGIPITALQVQPLTRYLLNYYVNQVADLMTVIPLTENPWKTIYFPRALMAIGELSALGRTSTAKNALLNALLAVSAFNLQSKFPKNSQPMKYYLNLGIALRNQASLFIKQLLHTKSDTQSGIEYCLSTEKYKDVLCAVMTMISVDLVWGTMQDTGVYISWCGKVILAKMANKKKLSSKARILHRIFSSLKLIQDSTCLALESIKEDFESNVGSGYDVNGDKFANTTSNVRTTIGKARIDFIVNNSFNSATVPTPSKKSASPSFVNKKLINTKKNDENFATDALYGLPNSLIVLFSDTVELLRTKIYYKETKRRLPDSFQMRVEVLNKKLINWKLDWELYQNQNEKITKTSIVLEVDEDLDDNEMKNVQIELASDCKKNFYSPMHQATYHHIMSFYHALTIYFNRLIQDIPPTKVQTKVAKTLNHLNAIQKLIAKGEAAIIPLFWQGFIAGCEAISPNLQMGFKKWGADIAQYLGSYWGARQIMLEVWRRKRMNEARDDWVSVVQDWEMNLMLN